jgi:hypothetical protein
MPSLPVHLPAPRDHAHAPAARERLGGRAMRTLLAAMWFGALLLAGVGARVTHGEWPGVYDWLVITPLLTLFAMLSGLLDLFGLPYDGGSALLHAAFFAFWGVMLVLHVLALLTGRRAYLVAIAAILAPAAWKWAVHAGGLIGI